ncbi:hypothetical protein CPB84DRAFT_1688279 [Gymnopilus junonius]|uniref:Uncharacterized protein n=1 Tax=Gymnopilus junonius TaxID=109634 RepID=A0A9P5NCR7_GYMJU|nr:hypothetical protein CPB84DRAFT_1688279 [Gymnopilus junonius]
MTQPRLSTVYDFSDLRLHSDGTRVYQKSTNLRPDLVKVTTRNSRFNWIAKEAGGSASVPRFRKKPKISKEREEDGEVDVDLPSQEDESTGGSQESSEEGDDVRKNGKKRKPKRIDTRKPKRLKFAKDYGYLDSESHRPAESAGEAPEARDYTIKLSEPSADLLKCIHRFASEFYTERGQLLNISREYRKERKQRALQKRARNEKRADKRKEDHEDSAAPSGSESEFSESETPPQDADDNSEDEESSGREVSDGGENDEGGSSSKNTKGKGEAKSKKPWKRKGRRRTDKLYTDMYKMFDGSAMMALGMSLQLPIVISIYFYFAKECWCRSKLLICLILMYPTAGKKR